MLIVLPVAENVTNRAQEVETLTEVVVANLQDQSLCMAVFRQYTWEILEQERTIENTTL